MGEGGDCCVQAIIEGSRGQNVALVGSGAVGSRVDRKCCSGDLCFILRMQRTIRRLLYNNVAAIVEG